MFYPSLKLSAIAVLRNSLLSIGLGMICASCSSSDSSSLKHDQGKPVRNSLAWNWRDVSDAEYTEVMAPVLGIARSAVLPVSNDLVERVQSWVDRIDQTLRASHSDQLASVPKPRAKVLAKSNPNAFVAPVPACYQVPVRLSGAASARQGQRVARVLIESRSGSVQPYESDAPCVDGSETQPSAETVAQFVERFNASSTTGCKYSVGADGSLVVGSKCEVEPSLAQVAEAESLVLLQTANHITVHSGIIPMMTEAAFVSVLTHELGHYYRAHVTANESEYGYFYTQQEQHVAYRPKAEPRLEKLGKDAVKATQVLDGGTYFRKVKGQKLRSDLYFLAGSVVTQSRDESAVCNKAYQHATNYEYNETMKLFPVEPKLTQAQEKAYLAFESDVVDCLKTLTFSRQAGFISSGFNWSTLTAIAANPTWPLWLDQVKPEARAALQELHASVAANLVSDSSESSVATVADALFNANRSIESVEAAAVTVLEKAHQERLGQYTYEQEADDLAVEFTAKLGLPTASVTDAMRALGKGQESSLHGYALGEQECETLRQNKWLDEDNKYVFVPVGGFLDPHHSICYRIFNIEREAVAHQAVPANADLPSFDDAAWKQLQRDAKSKRSDFLADDGNTDFPRAAQIVREHGRLSCLFDTHDALAKHP